MSEQTPCTRITALEMRCNYLEKTLGECVRRVEWEPYLWVMRALIVAALTILLTGVLTPIFRKIGA